MSDDTTPTTDPDVVEEYVSGLATLLLQLAVGSDRYRLLAGKDQLTDDEFREVEPLTRNLADAVEFLIELVVRASAGQEEILAAVTQASEAVADAFEGNQS